MKRTFTYKDDKSDKFWAIEIKGDSFTVTFGKTGTSGQTSTKTFADSATCQKEADKLIREKTGKGYVEGDVSATPAASTPPADASNKDPELYAKAKAILRKYHANYAELKKQVRQMLIDVLQLEPSDALIDWLAEIIRQEDWRVFSAQRIQDFKPDSSDYREWRQRRKMWGEKDDSSFKPYVEKEELTEAVTLSDKLTIGMRGSYYLANPKKAEQTLRDAIAELKTTKFTPDANFKFADWYVEMATNRRYNECCDLFEVLDNVTLDEPSRERVLAQALAVSWAQQRFDVTKKVAESGTKIEKMRRQELPSRLASYYAENGLGNNEDLMYKYLQIAVRRGAGATRLFAFSSLINTATHPNSKQCSLVTQWNKLKKPRRKPKQKPKRERNRKTRQPKPYMPS